ncbi:LysR family transcriptional regulator [Testudinibacter sp. TR-2022]|uniref:LysR family transcriptional regulator n=1 Tax=Testudinibacter sp. TR-2022 TaxID=2585029 RepID=UPI00111916E6|nr:LysR family transcriptional regulator [Testudinibacter sp. TR-2022]TNH09375.1 LysR family transcriptional regulator [Pasteurellaceae bacterium Phil11]TNH24141.1 LysR family transcriptional regulator [Testudinibacter sp. TR-2022]TNH29401.1 LysR family transcriptional regulator [Testudinibacter sp. TR-2022]
MTHFESIHLKAIRFFIQVYDCQSFSEVARADQVSPSMVSRIISQLEDALGQQLFYRNTRLVVPTVAGQQFIDTARRITEELQGMQQRWQEQAQEPNGVIRMNAPVLFARKHITPYLPELRKRYPQLMIELIQSDGYIDSHTHSADLIFRVGALADSSLKARVFAEQRGYLVASPQYLATHGTPQTPTDLEKHLALLHRGDFGAQRWLYRANGRKQSGQWQQQTSGTAVLTSNNAQTLVDCAVGGMGILLFPDWVLNEYLQSGQLVKLLTTHEWHSHTEPQYISAIYPNFRHPSLNTRAVLDFFMEKYGEQPYWQEKHAV